MSSSPEDILNKTLRNIEALQESKTVAKEDTYDASVMVKVLDSSMKEISDLIKKKKSNMADDTKTRAVLMALNDVKDALKKL